jgi:DNA-binding FadR family transcriptional regulator
VTKTRRARLSDEVVEHLSIDILTGRFAPETLLPPEPRLCERFGVSRSVVREAVARLARNGLLQVRHGVGTVVLARCHWNELDTEILRIRAANGLIGDLARDLLEIRRLVELEVAALAAQRRSEPHIAQIRQHLDTMSAEADNADGYTQADIAFHEALIAASGNDLLRQLMKPVNQVRSIGSILTIRRHPQGTIDSLRDHQEIYDAVVAGDAAAARAAMERHIAQFEHDLLDALVLANQGRLAELARNGAADGSLDSMPNR